MDLPKSRRSQKGPANSSSTTRKKLELAVTPVRELTEKDKKLLREHAQLQDFNEQWRAKMYKAAAAGYAGNREKSSTEVFCTKCGILIFECPLNHFTQKHRKPV